MPAHATALFGDRHAAHAAIEQLVQAGFPRDTISILMSESTHEREFGRSSSEGSGLRSARPTGVLGTIVTGLVVIPARGGRALRAVGPLVRALLRSSEEATSVTFSAALGAAGLPDHQARFLDEGVASGSIIVGVHASGDRARLATQLLELSGGAALQAA
ncbi:MAG TPA: hypothetical protein VN894_18270 [Polyangiaceae bacterium]|nr:hypothetical protein [Polyangiaceae bacterium]